MKVQKRYGRLNAGDERLMYDAPLALPVDYLLLLGSDDPDELARARWGIEAFDPGLLEQTAAADAASGGQPPDHPIDRRLALEPRLRRRAGQWRRSGVPALFLRAARRASEGRFTPELSPYLARIRFAPGDEPDEAPDFLALAAWSLDQVLHDGRFLVRNCALCGHPFLSSERASYCQRIAPRGSIEPSKRPPHPSCQDVGAVRDYRARKRAQKKVVEERARLELGC